MNDRFDYYRKAASRFGHLVTPEQFEEAIRNVAPEDVNRLATAYLTLRSRGDEAAVTEWIDSLMSPRAGLSKRERDYSWEVSRVLILFEYLAEKNIPPFRSLREEQVAPDPAALDWSTLPEALAPLAPLAARLPVHDRDFCIYAFFDGAEDAVRNELIDLASLIRRNGLTSVANDWTIKNWSNNRECAWRIDRLLGVLDAVGLLDG